MIKNWFSFKKEVEGMVEEIDINELDERLKKVESVIKNLGQPYTLKVTYRDGRIINYKNIARHRKTSSFMNPEPSKLLLYVYGETSGSASVEILQEVIESIEKVY